MASAGWALQQAVFAALTNDAPLLALLGAARVWDDVPAARRVSLRDVCAEGGERDWSAGADDGREHALTLHVWSRRGRSQGGARDHGRGARRAARRAGLALSGASARQPAPQVSSEARRDADGETTHGIVRFRAVTEPMGWRRALGR